MSKLRNTLLIALVLFGALGVTAGRASADLVKLGIAPANPTGSPFDPAVSPTGSSGDPDKPEQAPPRMNVSRGDRSMIVSGVASEGSAAALRDWARWTWVIWMARYLNLNP